MKHTPGPWAHKWINGRIAVVDEAGYEVARLDPLLTADQELEDARLIAAAPDLLAALESIETVLKGNKLANVGNSTIHYALCQARNAIAKATT